MAKDRITLLAEMVIEEYVGNGLEGVIIDNPESTVEELEWIYKENRELITELSDHLVDIVEAEVRRRREQDE